MSNERKYKVVIDVVDVKGKCRFGYKVGDEIVVEQNPEGYSYVPKINGAICPEAFANVYRNAFCMLYGGKIPWALDKERSIARTICSDPVNVVTFELRQKEITNKK
jgi:uncharacterized repeat protein (TIGR04076 family)